MTVYVAGDMLSMGAQRQRQYEVEELRKIGLTLHVPHEDGEINDKANVDNNGLAERIVRKDTEGLIESDIVVIDAHENGKGTLVELGQLKGMRDMAQIIKDSYDYWIADDVDPDYGYFVDDVETKVSEVLAKKVYAHNTDIRRANDKPQAGDRREYAPNQYVYGTVLNLTHGRGFREFNEIIEELAKGDG